MHDVIVIGAGSAGCAVAGRLTEAGLDVLLLEAGGPGDWDNIKIPALMDTLMDSPAYFSDQDDLDLTIAGLRKAIEVGRAAAVAADGARQIHPAPASDSDDALADYVRRNAGTVWHPSGTCKMGRDRLAVVDDKLRVHGIAGLRVADASIMPTIPSGNINAPCIMIGEKAAELVVAGR